MSHPDPPWSGWISSTGDALLILEAARRGLIPRVTRRLVDAERKMICSGSVFVFDEEESGIKRWTDGYFWSPSRILGNFLLYRETGGRGGRKRKDKDKEASPLEDEFVESPQDTDPKPARSLVGSLSAHTHNSHNPASSNGPPFHFKPDGLMKKTFSLTINGVPQHLISYYKPSDVTNGRLRSPSSLPELASLDISPEYLDKTHFRVPPKVEVGTDGVPRYRGDADEEEIINKGGPTSAGGVKVVKERRPTGLLSEPVHVNAKRPPPDQELEAPPEKRIRSDAPPEQTGPPAPPPAMVPMHAAYHPIPIPASHSPPASSPTPSHPQYVHPYYSYPAMPYAHAPPHMAPPPHMGQAMHPHAYPPPYYPVYAWPQQQQPLPPPQQPAEAAPSASVQ